MTENWKWDCSFCGKRQDFDHLQDYIEDDGGSCYSPQDVVERLKAGSTKFTHVNAHICDQFHVRYTVVPTSYCYRCKGSVRETYGPDFIGWWKYRIIGGVLSVSKIGKWEIWEIGNSESMKIG